MNELGFEAFTVIWLGFGITGIVLLFSKGLAAKLVRRVSEGGPLGYVVLAVLIPILLLLGTFSYLGTMVSEDARQCKTCGNRKKIMQLYCPNCEQPVARGAVARAT